MILIAYDGSADARAAIQRAGQLLSGHPATVLSVWERFQDVLTRSGAGMPIGSVDYDELDRSYDEQARERAEEGAELAVDPEEPSVQREDSLPDRGVLEGGLESPLGGSCPGAACRILPREK